MKFSLEIEMNNDAFAVRPDMELERILKAFSDVAGAYVRVGQVEGSLRDENGNRVGKWRIASCDQFRKDSRNATP